MTIPEIIKKYRAENSLREFAALISEKMIEPISYQAVKDWEDGNYIPRYYTILPIAMHYNDWRRTMALEILEVLRPDLLPPPTPDLSR
jgi:hypothetical protein